MFYTFYWFVNRIKSLNYLFLNLIVFVVNNYTVFVKPIFWYQLYKVHWQFFSNQLYAQNTTRFKTENQITCWVIKSNTLCCCCCWYFFYWDKFIMFGKNVVYRVFQNHFNKCFLKCIKNTFQTVFYSKHNTFKECLLIWSAELFNCKLLCCLKMRL